MKTKAEIKEIAIQTITKEYLAIEKLKDSIDDNFSDAVNLIFNSKGRVVISGIGKSANIATKIVSTLNSTGTPSIFMHAADAIHGDLGIIQKDDIIICISKSGNTPEIKAIIPLIKNLGNKLIAICGEKDSDLAKKADYFLNTHVEREACPNNLAPTTSTTAQLVMGDALAMCLLECRGFSSEDFAKYHPGGALGKRLYLKVSDLYPNNEKPFVREDALLDETILEISSKRLGCVAVVSKDNRIEGIITDGDLRRMLSKNTYNKQTKAKDIMSLNPKTIDKDSLAVEALNIMKDNSITQLLVVDEKENYIGVIHLHDLLKEGII
ncbi:MAG: KpsF/GutQ family sugar-phosphate isomerase [Bacteroidales bacterium]|jgi:arabinose-5-phosphate isomerase|nr:KpsF/GutQ family sugar-phosphate isomerase [Bacteroidales bacterium]